MSRWLGSVTEAARLARILAASIAALWCALPFTLQFMLHPGDVIRLQRWFEGQPIPTEFSAQQLFTGEITACLILAGLVLLLLGLLTVLYHQLQFAVTLWPVAAISLGLIGNFWWLLGLGFYDLQGIAAGLVPAVLTAFWQRAAEGWAQDFIFGRGIRPPFSGAR